MVRQLLLIAMIVSIIACTSSHKLSEEIYSPKVEVDSLHLLLTQAYESGIELINSIDTQNVHIYAKEGRSITIGLITGLKDSIINLTDRFNPSNYQNWEINIQSATNTRADATFLKHSIISLKQSIYRTLGRLKYTREPFRIFIEKTERSIDRFIEKIDNYIDSSSK